MGTRRSVSARLPASGSGMVRATGDAHDPLESEADRLLAATCQRLGMLGVIEDGGSDSEGSVPSFDVKDDSKAGDVLYEMRKDLKYLVSVTDEMEQGYLAGRRKEFGVYRHLLMTDTVIQDVCILVKHLQFTVEPAMDLRIVTGALEAAGDEVKGHISRMESRYPMFRNEGREIRHKDASFDESKVPDWWEHSRHSSRDGGGTGLVDKTGYPRDMKKAGFDKRVGGEGETGPERESEGSSPFEEGTGEASESVRAARAYAQAVKDAESGAGS